MIISNSTQIYIATYREALAVFFQAGTLPTVATSKMSLRVGYRIVCDARLESLRISLDDEGDGLVSFLFPGSFVVARYTITTILTEFGKSEAIAVHFQAARFFTITDDQSRVTIGVHLLGQR